MLTKDQVQRAVLAYDVDQTVIRTIEELAELQQALAKFLREPRPTGEKMSKVQAKIREEMVDVAIQLDIMRSLVGHDTAVTNQKLDRFDRRLEKQENGHQTISPRP
jgi:NTP pyrophosphatase (non-canonical NTP hydrolase)